MDGALLHILGKARPFAHGRLPHQRAGANDQAMPPLAQWLMGGGAENGRVRLWLHNKNRCNIKAKLTADILHRRLQHIV